MYSLQSSSNKSQYCLKLHYLSCILNVSVFVFQLLQEVWTREVTSCCATIFCTVMVFWYTALGLPWIPDCFNMKVKDMTVNNVEWIAMAGLMLLIMSKFLGHSE